MLPAQEHEIKLENGGEVAAAIQDCSDTSSFKVRCVSNCEDTAFDSGSLLDHETSVLSADEEEVEIDVIGCNGDGDFKVVKDEDADATDEFSSSFGDTFSGAEDGSRLSDAEVESRLRDDNDGMDSNVFEGLDSLFRMGKKKLTSEWRSYSSPLRWRCKWMELRMKELRSQELKYDRVLAAICQKEHLDLHEYSSEYGVKALPFPEVCHGKKVMKRKKRNRVEETVDIPLYMSHHNLFSYYENKRFDPDAGSLDDDCGIQVIEANDMKHDEFDFDDGFTSLQFRDDDALEQILWNIGKIESRVQKMTIDMDKLRTVNGIKFSSVENLSLLGQSDQPSSSTRSLTLSPHNGDTRPVGSLYTPPRNMPEYDIGDMAMMESAVSSYEEASPPDIIESTMGLLSAADISNDQQQNGDFCENIADDILIHNQAADKELHHFEKIGSLLIEKPKEHIKVEEDKVIAPTSASVSEECPVWEASRAPEKSIHVASEFRVPKTKRKRGERKAGAGAWNADKISIK